MSDLYPALTWRSIPPYAPLCVRLTPGPSSTVLHLGGEIDMGNCAMVTAAIDEAVSRYHPESIMFNLAAVTFLGTDGIRCLIHAHRRLGCRNGAVTIAAASRTVHSVLAITGVAELFSWSEEPALLDGHGSST